MVHIQNVNTSNYSKLTFVLIRAEVIIQDLQRCSICIIVWLRVKGYNSTNKSDPTLSIISDELYRLISRNTNKLRVEKSLLCTLCIVHSLTLEVRVPGLQVGWMYRCVCGVVIARYQPERSGSSPAVNLLCTPPLPAELLLHGSPPPAASDLRPGKQTEEEDTGRRSATLTG